MIPQSKTWKTTYIRALVTLAGPWGGSVRALSIFAVGDNLGNWLLSEKKLMWEQRTSSSLAWLMPHFIKFVKGKSTSRICILQL